MHQFAERQMVSITGTNAFYEKMNADDKRELDTLKDLVKVRWIHKRIKILQDCSQTTFES